MIRSAIWSSMIFLITISVATAGTITGKVQVNGKGSKEVIVYLEGISGEFSPPTEAVVMAQKAQKFVPSRLAVLKGSTVLFPNKDTVFHNAFSFSVSNPFNVGTYGPGKSPSVKMTQPGVVDLFCNMHEQMHAVVMVLEHPYFSNTDKKGTYMIANVPAGSYEIKAWRGPSKMKSHKVTVHDGNNTTVDFEFLQ